jgi:hypothetical protein
MFKDFTGHDLTKIGRKTKLVGNILNINGINKWKKGCYILEILLGKYDSTLVQSTR